MPNTSNRPAAVHAVTLAPNGWTYLCLVAPGEVDESGLRAYGEELAVLRTALSDLFAFYRQERPSGDCPGDGRHPHGGGWDCPPCDAWRALYERDAQPPAMRSTAPAPKGWDAV